MTDTRFSPRDWQVVAERSSNLVRDFLSRQDAPFADFKRMNEVFMDAFARLMNDPSRLAEAHANLWCDYMSLWQTTTRRMMGEDVPPVIEPEAGDRRFKDDSWSNDAVFDHIKQSYLLSANWLQTLLGGVDGLEPKERRKLDFYTKLFIDALSPTNFAATNPEVLRATLESKGENLVKGLSNLLEDLERGKGRLSIHMVDEDAFEVGGNLAVTPGKVVFRNDLIELVQYSPTTEKVHRRPLLIIPPWINKYYILDLKPQNSFVRWVVEQGHTVFIISWVNPDAALASKTFEDYMIEGPLAALDAVGQATGEERVNALGYCIGGTLLACTLAHLAVKYDNRIASATYLTSLVDFEDVGNIEVFIDDDQIRDLERVMAERGYLDGSEMAAAFNTLRANDLIWSFVINNYLLGKDPFPFDILYWNSDSTRLPAAMHSYYLRRMYLDNALIEPGALELDGTPIDLSSIETPSYLLSTQEDHIAPWKSAYRATGHYRGKTVFTLAASGHVAGVVNPPSKNKYGFWTNSSTPEDPQAWFDGAKRHEGSWWPHWQAWLARKGGGKVDARAPGDADLPVIEDAPGSYVKVDLRRQA